MSKTVNYQFKVLYVFLMFGVLCGHLGIVERYMPWIEIFSFYGFGIQLFLFISGYFYSSKYDSTPVSFLLKKIKTILIPYILWNLFYIVVELILKAAGFKFAGNFSAKTFISIFIRSPVSHFNSPSWFLMPFFIAEIFCSFERFLLSKVNNFAKEVLLLLFNFGIGMLSIHIAMQSYGAGGYYEGNYLQILRAAFMVPWFSFGYFYKTYLEKHDTLASTWYYLIVVLAAILYIFVNRNASSYFVVIMGGYENVVLPVITSFIGIALYLRLARDLTPVLGHVKVVNAIADNTFSIMTHHCFGYFIFSGIFILIAKLLPFLPEPDMEQFFSDSGYYYMPRLKGFPLLYIISAFAFSIYLQKLVNYIKGCINKK